MGVALLPLVSTCTHQVLLVTSHVACGHLLLCTAVHVAHACCPPAAWRRCEL
jgi:hypothetical protein